MNTYVETIAAIATAPGRGGVGIIRISGPLASEIAKQLTQSTLPQPRYAAYRRFIDADDQILDQGILIFFPGPHSFTGEDVIEVQGHGGPVVMSLLLKRIITLGARHALAGEFSQRAFLNDRMDLAQAEAVADLIDAASESAVYAANRSLSGAFSEAVNQLQTSMIECRMWVESAIDFPEEEIDFLADDQLSALSQSLEQQLATLLAQAREGRVLREGIRVVFLGRPNAGKSSLLNALSGEAAAIVSDIPGTTRDLVKEKILIQGMPVHIVDTAGLRSSDDHIEQQGVERALSEARLADVVLEVVDSSQGMIELALPEDLQHIPHFQVFNKVDLIQNKAQLNADPSCFYVSAKTGEGLDALKTALYDQATGGHHEGVFSARQRHLDLLEKVKHHVHLGLSALREQSAGELLAEELRVAQQLLSEITGEFTPDDLLGSIFSSFCIGK